jgi:hypothetical protein
VVQDWSALEVHLLMCTTRTDLLTAQAGDSAEMNTCYWLEVDAEAVHVEVFAAKENIPLAPAHWRLRTGACPLQPDHCSLLFDACSVTPAGVWT